MLGDERVGITGLTFAERSELLVSYDEFVYLFTPDMGLGPNPVPSSLPSKNFDANRLGGDHVSASSPSNVDVDETVTKGHRNC